MSAFAKNPWHTLSSHLPVRQHTTVMPSSEFCSQRFYLGLSNGGKRYPLVSVDMRHGADSTFWWGRGESGKEEGGVSNTPPLGQSVKEDCV